MWISEEIFFMWSFSELGPFQVELPSFWSLEASHIQRTDREWDRCGPGLEMVHITSTHISLAKLGHLVVAPNYKGNWEMQSSCESRKKRTHILLITSSVYI